MKHCYFCDGFTKEIKDKPYRYDECGLPVILLGITQHACEKCNETYVSIPNIQQLHRMIGINVCKNRKALLKPEEIKFLRKNLHLKSKELAQTLGVTPQTVSRWENGSKVIGEPHDRFFRSLYMMHVSEQAHHLVFDNVIDTFKELPIKRKEIQEPTEITLNLRDWMEGFAVQPKPNVVHIGSGYFNKQKACNYQMAV